jgi:hypothetical protein
MLGSAAIRRHTLRAVVWLAALIVPSGQLASQNVPEPQAVPDPGDAISVTLLTFGPGDGVIEVWAHNAIWVRDPSTGLDRAYNWGVFNFNDPGFMLRFVKGTMMYMMVSDTSDRMLREYVYYNRDIYAQELNLTGAQKRALIERLLANDTDATRYYRYQYYLDNCSTRARDALDDVLGGRIAAALDTVQTGTTWRWHTRRVLRPSFWSYLGIELGLGNPADEQLTAWQESFLPMRLREHMRLVTVLDEAGREVPLVARETQLFQATGRAPETVSPPSWFLGFMLAGLALAAVVAASGAAMLRSARRAGLGRTVWTFLATGWSLVIGLAGLFFVLAWALTDHTFWYFNENLLQATPLSLVLVPVIVAAVRGRSWGVRWIAPCALAILALSVIGFVLQPLPGFDQFNGDMIAAILPVHAAVAWVAIRMGRTATGSDVETRPSRKQTTPNR